MAVPAERRHEFESAAGANGGLRPDCEPDELEEVDLSSLLDLQDERQEKDSKRTNRVILKSCGLVFVAVLVWYAVSSTHRRQVDGLIQNVKESRTDVKQMSNPKGIMGSYDEVLQKLGSRSEDIDTATRSLGVDPTTVKEDGMDPEMKGMMGGKGRTVGERERMVEGLAHMTGIELAEPNRSAADPEVEPPAEPQVPATKTPPEADPAK